MRNLIPFRKEYQDAKALVQLLLSRGLAIDDSIIAEQYLKTISYYRLSAYMHPLLQVPKSSHIFKIGTSFEQVMMLYRFDKKLRLFIFNEIEKIEIAVRTTIVDVCTTAFRDSFWLTDDSYFIDTNKFHKTLALIRNEIAKSHEEFITHFKDTYSNAYPPAWILAEILPLGVLTNIFINIKDPQVKKRIAMRFGLQLRVFVSWMTIVTVTRNACCHHVRVWNKHNMLTPMNPRRTTHAWITLPTNPRRIYYDLCIIKYFLDAISPNNDMGQKLRDLLATFPLVDSTAMGFPEGWENEGLWNI